MKTPMIVHWHARRSRIDERHAEELWQEAVRYATEKTGWVGTPEYYATAVEHFRALMAAEAPAAFAAERIAPMMRAQTRAWMIPLQAFHGLTAIANRALTRSIPRIV